MSVPASSKHAPTYPGFSGRPSTGRAVTLVIASGWGGGGGAADEVVRCAPVSDEFPGL